MPNRKPRVWACWHTGAASPHTDMTERVLSLAIYLFVLFYHFYYYLLLYCVHAVIMCVEIRGQSPGAASLLHPMGPRDQTQIVRLDGNCLYLLNCVS